MERKFITEKTLISILNNDLREYEECNQCEFTSIMKLEESDLNGCNWSSAALRCSGESGELCMPFASTVVTEGKTKYNLKKLNQ